MLKPSGLDLCRAQLAKRKENNIGKALLARLIVETVAEVVARGIPLSLGIQAEA